MLLTLIFVSNTAGGNGRWRYTVPWIGQAVVLVMWCRWYRRRSIAVVETAAVLHRWNDAPL